MTGVREYLYERKRWTASAGMMLGVTCFAVQSYLVGIATFLTALTFCWSVLPHADRTGRGPVYERYWFIQTFAVLMAVGCAVGGWLALKPD